MERATVQKKLKGELRGYVNLITQKSRGKDSYVCPLCASGTRKNGTGAFSIKDTMWKCFSCNRSGDIFDLIGAHEGIPHYIDQVNRAREIFNLISQDSTDPDTGAFITERQNRAKTAPCKDTGSQKTYANFFSKAAKDINKTSYHRGLSPEILKRFNIGYVHNWRHPNAPQAPLSPRLIIPTSPYSYLARDTRSNIPARQRAYSKSKVGSAHLFNQEALINAKKSIFIVEGELDALSIMEVGGEAIGLGSTSNTRAMLNLLKENKPNQRLILALGNDDAGKKAAKELSKGLQELGIPFYYANPAGQYNDPNEALQRDRGAFASAVASAESMKGESMRAAQINQSEKEAYLRTSAEGFLQNFIDGIKDSVNTPSIATGFDKLDNLLDGGLYEGLYIFGAISSLGKTSLITQIADQMAQKGQDVLVFSLEMARSEIMAKSISRHTVQHNLSNGRLSPNAKTTREITSGKRYVGYSKEETDLITSSIRQYGEYAHHIYISEGVGNIGVNQIRESVKTHILYTGNTPVVIIDYLQILAPYNEKSTDKQNTDKAVLELKRISRDYKTPVIGISSFNRENYKEAVSMKAFKESGAIEYSSDVLIGLQLKGTGIKEFDEGTLKKKSPREIELVILKNRNGCTGETVSFKYYPRFNYFEQG